MSILMKVTIKRTQLTRMTDMYSIYFSPPKERFVCFTRREFKKEFPNIKLNRGEEKEFDLMVR